MAINQDLLKQLQQLIAQQGGGQARQPSSPRPSKERIKQLQSATAKRSRNNTRAIKDPKRAFGALGKLAKNMNPQQLKQLQQGMGNVFGQNFKGLNAGNQAAEAFENMGNQSAGEFPGSFNQRVAGNKIQELLGQMGFAGPGGPGINPPPGQPPIGFPPGPPGVMGQPVTGGPRVSNPGTFFGGQQSQLNPQQQPMGGATGQAGSGSNLPSTGTPQLNLGAVKGGAMGMGGGTNNNLMASSANTSPTTSSPGVGVGTGPLTSGAGTTGTNQIANTVSGSNLLNNPVHSAQDIQQATYNPLINMPSQAEVTSQLATPGRSMVGNQFGGGGLAATQMQNLATQAAQQGVGDAQNLIGQNIQQGLQGQALQSNMDLANRQQFVNHMGTLLGPGLQGTATGFQQALGGLSRGPQFIGV